MTKEFCICFVFELQGILFVWIQKTVFKDRKMFVNYIGYSQILIYDFSPWFTIDSYCIKTTMSILKSPSSLRMPSKFAKYTWGTVLFISISETRPLFCTAEHFVYIFMDPDPTWKTSHQQIRLVTNMKFAGVNIYGHPNIWCEDQHGLTTKTFFYLELKRNRQFYRLLAEQITIRLLAPPMTNGNDYEKPSALKLFGSHTTRIIISIQLQIKYIWLIIKLDFEIFP
jgi:hypothetical protein